MIDPHPVTTATVSPRVMTLEQRVAQIVQVHGVTPLEAAAVLERCGGRLPVAMAWVAQRRAADLPILPPDGGAT